MKTAIWIIVNSDNRNLVYPAVVAEVKKAIECTLEVAIVRPMFRKFQQYM